MEFPGELVAGDEQPQCVSRSNENRRVRKRRQSRPEAAAATIPNATGCCQSIQSQDTPHAPPRNREFFGERNDPRFSSGGITRSRLRPPGPFIAAGDRRPGSSLPHPCSSFRHHCSVEDLSSAPNGSSPLNIPDETKMLAGRKHPKFEPSDCWR
jgi:hypothetical protein